MNLKRSLLFTWTLIIACIVLIPAAWAQYPEKPINLIVGFKAGGTSDSVARFLAKSLQTQLGQPVLVVNKPGGGGTLAATTVKKSAPDGYNIAVIGSILGPIFEVSLRRSLILSDNNLLIFLTCPIALVFIIMAALSMWRFEIKGRGKK